MSLVLVRLVVCKSKNQRKKLPFKREKKNETNVGKEILVGLYLIYHFLHLLDDSEHVAGVLF